MAAVVPKKFANKRIWYGVLFCVLLVLAIASPFVNEAPRVTTADMPINSGDVAWMLASSALVLLMTPGLAFFYGGMVGSKNVISTMLQNIISMGLLSILWVVFGFSLSFGEDVGHFYGKPWTYWMFKGVGAVPEPNFSSTIPIVLFAIFQMKFAIITPALITGSFAERVRFPGYFMYIMLWHIVVYCPLAHWTWHPEGFLRKWGVLDFAGGTVVHMTAGWAALAGAIVLGRRKSHKEKVPHAPANIPFVILGTGLLWFGWFGFNAGSALAANESACLAFLTTNTAAAMAMMTWLFFDGLQGRKPSAVGACVAAVVGLVVITPAAGYVSVQSAICMGFIGAVISNVACTLKAKSSLDDTLDVFPCHGVGGMTGLICTGFFAKDVGVVAGFGKTFGYHWLCLVIVAGYSFVVSYILYVGLNFIIPLRVDAWKEEQGLDVSQHGETLYTYENILDSTVCSTCSASNLGQRNGSLYPQRASNAGLLPGNTTSNANTEDPLPEPTPYQPPVPENSLQFFSTSMATPTPTPLPASSPDAINVMHT